MSKYTRQITQTLTDEDQGFTINVDVYDVLRAFAVTDPAIQHAIKKLLCTGIRGHKDSRQDLEEAIQSIQRALDAVKIEELLNQPIDAEFEIVPPADPPQAECAFKVGDMVELKAKPGEHWRVAFVDSAGFELISPTNSQSKRFIWRYGYDKYQLVAAVGNKPAECPFKVGDIIINSGPTRWKIDRILPNRLHVTSDDPYQTPSQIDRQFWGNYRIVVPTTIDATQQTC